GRDRQEHPVEYRHVAILDRVFSRAADRRPSGQRAGPPTGAPVSSAKRVTHGTRGHDNSVAKTREEEQLPRSRWRLVGPGIVVAATGVGAGDLVATTVAGERYGYTLLWAAVLGCLIKISLAEAAGRWHLATGTTLFEGWRTLGPWTTVYFAGYVA